MKISKNTKMTCAKSITDPATIVKYTCAQSEKVKFLMKKMQKVVKS